MNIYFLYIFKTRIALENLIAYRDQYKIVVSMFESFEYNLRNELSKKDPHIGELEEIIESNQYDWSQL